MFEQQLYTRKNTGFDTVCSSSGLTKELAKALPGKFLSDADRKNFPVDIKIRYRFFDGDGKRLVIGQSMQRDEPENRSPILVHNYVSISPSDFENADINTLSSENIPFIESFTEADSGKVLATQNLPMNIAYFPNQNGKDNTIGQLALNLISNMDQNKRQRAFIILDVESENQTKAATDFMKILYSYLPYNIRYKVGFSSLFTGNYNNELYINAIQIYFVPKNKGISQNRLGSNLSVAKEIVIDYANSKVTNLQSFPSALTELFSEDVATINQYFGRINTETKRYLFEHEKTLDVLENFYKVTKANTREISTEEILKIIDVFHDIQSREISSRLIAFLNFHTQKLNAKREAIDDVLISKVLSLPEPEFKDIALNMLQINLQAYQDDESRIVETIALTSSHPEINQRLISEKIVGEENLFVTYFNHCISEQKVKDLASLVREIDGLYQNYSKSFSVSRYLGSFYDKLSSRFRRIFVIENINQELIDAVNNKKDLETWYEKFVQDTFQTLSFEDLKKLKEKDYINFSYTGNQLANLANNEHYNIIMKLKTDFENLSNNYLQEKRESQAQELQQSKQIENNLLEVLDTMIKQRTEIDVHQLQLIYLKTCYTGTDIVENEFLNCILEDRQSENYTSALEFLSELWDTSQIDGAIEALDRKFDNFDMNLQKKFIEDTNLKLKELTKKKQISKNDFSDYKEKLKEIFDKHNPPTGFKKFLFNQFKSSKNDSEEVSLKTEEIEEEENISVESPFPPHVEMENHQCVTTPLEENLEIARTDEIRTTRSEKQKRESNSKKRTVPFLHGKRKK